MPDDSGPDRGGRSNAAGFDPDALDNDDATGRVESGADPVDEQATDPDDPVTPVHRTTHFEAEPVTEVIIEGEGESGRQARKPDPRRGERRFTAPGFDAKETTVIETGQEPATEFFRARQAPRGPKRPTPRGPKRAAPRGPKRPMPRPAMPQLISPRLGARLRPSSQHSWGWVLALILIILALAAVAVLGTVLLTRGGNTKAASPRDQVRSSIEGFDIAVQNGDLAALRGITCGKARDGYLNYDEQEWTATYQRVAAAKQYPVVASVDQVVVDGEHAEANVTAFMAYAPRVRSTRSFDLRYRDGQWKICQS